MPFTFNIALGLFAGLVGLVVGLATMLLVWWQAPNQRDNQLMVLYMASVAVWGLAGLLLNIAVVAGWDPRWFHQLLSFTIALNCYSTFVLAVRFARIKYTPLVRGALLFGAICLLIVMPLIFSDRIVVLHEVTPEGLFVYDFLPMGLPFMSLVLLYYVAALGVIWWHRDGPAGQLLAGGIIIVVGLIISLIPSLGAYAIDVLTSAVASLLFARSILKEQLFGPLARLNADLAASNAQLTLLSEGLQVTADELRRSRDAAEAANLAKSQFLATMSHELRTPLTSIIGYSDLIRVQLHDEGSFNANDIEIIAKAGRHLLALINDMLDMARIEAQRIVLDVTSFEISATVDDLAAALCPLVAKSGNELIVHCAPTLGAMVSDRVRLRQILLNLLGNAIKFTDHGTIVFTVSREQVGDREIVTFEVADSGIGMTPEQIGFLFQPFMQVDASVTRQYGGTGLGLALSQRLCSLLDGEITVRSELGAGSTFTVKVPARLPADNPDYMQVLDDESA